MIQYVSVLTIINNNYYYKESLHHMQGPTFKIWALSILISGQHSRIQLPVQSGVVFPTLLKSLFSKLSNLICSE
jgi:hypothetical protein